MCMYACVAPRVRTLELLKPPKKKVSNYYPHLNTYALQDSNLHFDIMNIKFYLLSQELDLLLQLFKLNLKFRRTFKPFFRRFWPKLSHMDNPTPSHVFFF